jgi:hypothetical protein
MAFANPSRSIADLLRDVIAQLTSLLRKEAQLARVELSENVSRAAVGLGLIVGGAVLLIPALVILLQAAVAALEQNGMRPAEAAGIVGGCDRLSEAGSRATDAAGSVTTEAREHMRAGAAAVSDAAADAATQTKEAMSGATAQVKDAASQVTDTTVRLKDAATGAGAAFGDTVSDTYDRAAAAGRAATTVASSASRITSSAAASGRDFIDFCRDQPLVLAGIGLAVGAAAGALLPRTQTEDQLMGDVSDALKEQTKEFAGEQLQKAKKVGERAYDAAEREAERQGLSGEAVANEATSRIKDTSSIAPSSEVDSCNDQTGEKKSEPVHERH